MKTSHGTHLALGKYGENLAKKYLLSRHYEFLAQNWRYKNLELDLVFRDREEIVFVEVKTRKNGLYGGSAGAITRAKKINIIRAAEAWLLEKQLWDNACRFDVVCITGNHLDYKLEHFINAFDPRQIMDSCDTYWQ